MTKIYNFDAETGELVGSDMADPSPLEPGAFLVPAHATTIQPPPCSGSQKLVFKAGAWSVIDAVVDTQTPVDTPTLDEIRANKWACIKEKRDSLMLIGGYKVGAKWFHSDQKSRSQQLGLVLLGTSVPANLQWKTMDGSFVTMTPALAQQILAAGAASDAAIFAVGEAHKAALYAAADPSVYDYSTGWPKIFGE